MIVSASINEILQIITLQMLKKIFWNFRTRKIIFH